MEYPPKKCKMCGEMFVPNHGSRVYCSKECSTNPLVRLVNRYYNICKKEMEKGKEVLLTQQEYIDLKQGKCCYCSKYDTYILYRIDYDKPYSKDNIRPICSLCSSVRGRMVELHNHIHYLWNMKNNKS